ncbi:MAG: hypothetical protein M3Z85_19520, partial [Acidobacteriota bacterium]|nr:hypothetical protein [Acidobacteriota bacterium]
MRFPQFAILSALFAAVSLSSWSADKPVAPQDPKVNIEPRAKPSAAPGQPLPRANIRVDTNVVQIPVTVT